jgi:hypothetical protein
MRYVGNLTVPDGYEIEQCSVWEASSMASGYNEAMRSSDAKYKVYLHQDVFVTNRDFIKELLQIFSDETVGMFGMVGSPILPENGIMWAGERVGTIYTSNIIQGGPSDLTTHKRPWQEVEAIDGLLMATQVDLPWREDLFTGWDFYDISQSFEFRKKGYKVVVPYMQEPWCIHDDGVINLEHYFSWQKVFLEHYRSSMSNI